MLVPSKGRYWMCVNGCLKHSLTLLALLRASRPVRPFPWPPALTRPAITHPLMYTAGGPFLLPTSLPSSFYNCNLLGSLDPLGLCWPHSTTNICLLDTFWSNNSTSRNVLHHHLDYTKTYIDNRYRMYKKRCLCKLLSDWEPLVIDSRDQTNTEWMVHA